MSTWGKIKKSVKSATRKVAPIVSGGMWKPGAKSESDDSRSQAAGQLLKRDVSVAKQAGSGQIKYTGEEEYTA